MMVLIVGLILFLGVHLLPTSPELRDDLRERLGANTYRALFSLLSLAGFIIIVLGYHKLQLHPGKNPVLWNPPVWTRHIAVGSDAAGDDFSRRVVDTVAHSHGRTPPDADRNQDLGLGTSHRQWRSRRASAVWLVSRFRRL